MSVDQAKINIERLFAIMRTADDHWEQTMLYEALVPTLAHTEEKLISEF